jgi:hypothetical protein
MKLEAPCIKHHIVPAFFWITTTDISFEVVVTTGHMRTVFQTFWSKEAIRRLGTTLIPIMLVGVQNQSKSAYASQSAISYMPLNDLHTHKYPS